jgi:hypothetical protein
MPNAELSRRVGRPLCELSAPQRRELHEALLEADSCEPPDQIEKRGVVQDVIVPIVQSGVGGAAAGYAAGKVGQGKKPDDKE